MLSYSTSNNTMLVSVYFELNVVTMKVILTNCQNGAPTFFRGLSLCMSVEDVSQNKIQCSFIPKQNTGCTEFQMKSHVVKGLII